MISLTNKAVQQIKNIMEQENLANHYLRIGVKGGGCSGMTYTMSFDSQLKESDQLLEQGQVKVVVDSKSMVYLIGTTIDFTDGLNGSGFVFQNPNAARSCGCGSSFAV